MCTNDSNGNMQEQRVIKRGKNKPPSVCEICKTRKPAKYGFRRRDRKWRCHACYSYARRHNGKNRPVRFDQERRCLNCKRPHDERRRYCLRCLSHKNRYGEYPDQDNIQRYAPHGWCECGKPATQFVEDLQTGVLHVNVHIDKVEQAREYGEWMCDECAGYEYEMRGIDGNDYRPTGYFKREAAD